MEAKVSIRSSFCPPQKFINLSPELRTFRLKLKVFTKVVSFSKILEISKLFWFGFLTRARPEHRSACSSSSAQRTETQRSAFSSAVLEQKIRNVKNPKNPVKNINFGKNYFPSFFTLIIFPACGSATVIVLLRNYQWFISRHFCSSPPRPLLVSFVRLATIECNWIIDALDAISSGWMQKEKHKSPL